MDTDEAEEHYDAFEEEDLEKGYDDALYRDIESENAFLESDSILSEREADAMIADTFWGLEVYSVAFVVLLCLCCGCYMVRNDCCGYLEMESLGLGAKKVSDVDGAFGYAKYSQPIGFKAQFGNAYDDKDVEMGRSIDQEHSDEQECLHS